MSDVKDILGVPRAGGEAAPKPEPKPKVQKMKRPEGMSREAFALLGDSHPIMSTQLAPKKKDLKAKPKASTKGVVTWLWKPIVSSARPLNDLNVLHWAKAYKDAAGRVKEAEEDYSYAKFNKKVQLLKYNDEEYDHLIAPDSGDWSRAETDYLMDMCERFDLRFIVIADRYEFVTPLGGIGPARRMEDLKERYYTIARRLLIAREGGEAAVANHVLVRHPFNKAYEVERKQAIEQLLQRPPQQTLEENAILAEARVIEERWKQEAANNKRAAAAAAAAAQAAANAQAAASAQAAAHGTPAAAAAALVADAMSGERRFPDSFPNGLQPGVPTLFNAAMEPERPPKPGVYPRGVSALNLANSILSAMPGGPKAQKAMEASLQDPTQWGLAAYMPRCGTRAVCGAWLALRQELMGLLELRRVAGPQGKAQAGADGSRQKRRK